MQGLSIVIVNWNTKDLLLQLLTDLLPYGANPDRALEVVVVDNDSHDGSVAAARQHFPDLCYLPQAQNLGFAGGVNRGLEASRHPLILLLNTDVRAPSESIEALARYADDHPNAAVVGPRVTNADGSFQSSYWRFPSLTSLFLSATWLYKLAPNSTLLNPQGYAATRFDRPTPVDAVSGCVFLLRRSVIQDIGPLDDSYFMYFEETDFCYRAWRSGYTVHYAPVASFVHFGRASTNLAETSSFLEFRQSTLRYFRKHRGLPAALLARFLLALFLILRLPYWSLVSLTRGERGPLARAKLKLYLIGLAYLLFHSRDRTHRNCW